MAARGTRATEQLTKLGVAYQVHSYAHGPGRSGPARDGSSESYGAQAAAELGVPAERVFKTLVASVDGSLTIAVVPVDRQLNLKALADAAGGKKAEMAQTTVAERATGYVVGGISPIAQRRRMPVIVDATALEHETVYCSAGQRGLQIELAPRDLVLVTGATVAPIGKPSAG